MKGLMIRTFKMLLTVAVLIGLMASARSAAGSSGTLLNSQNRFVGSSETVQLRANRGYTRPGGGVQVRLENNTKNEVAYGFEYELAIWKKGSWVRLSTRPVFSPRLFVQPESVSAWQRIPVPKKATPGRYRIQKQVEILLGEKTEKRQIATRFRVADS